ncbi:hypothetical protein [Planctomycetes bacterium Pan216]|uniref:hypothetical protein n=1 Tax=Kolteria novifilia TaxID=2527975 RepID=UPI00119E9A4B
MTHQFDFQGYPRLLRYRGVRSTLLFQGYPHGEAESRDGRVPGVRSTLVFQGYPRLLRYRGVRSTLEVSGGTTAGRASLE